MSGCSAKRHYHLSLNFLNQFPIRQSVSAPWADKSVAFYYEFHGICSGETSPVAGIANGIPKSTNGTLRAFHTVVELKKMIQQSVDSAECRVCGMGWSDTKPPIAHDAS